MVLVVKRIHAFIVLKSKTLIDRMTKIDYNSQQRNTWKKLANTLPWYGFNKKIE